MTIVRQLDCRIGDGILVAPNLNQEIYVLWTKFLRYAASQSVCTIIASNYGASGTGEDFHDQANPAGENAFIYAEFNNGVLRFGVLIQWADSVGFGTSPGNPGLLNGGGAVDGVGMAMAVREDGTSPWAGTANDDGSDTKGATVWTPGTSVVHPFPRSNATGGNHATLKQNTTYAARDTTSGFGRLHWVANENGIFSLHSFSDNGNYAGFYLGRYTVRTGLTIPTHPYVMISHPSDLFWPTGASQIYGGTTGGTTRNGGILATPGDDTRDTTLGLPTAGQQATQYQPNMLSSPSEFEAGSVSVFQHETNFGLAGFLPTDLVRHVFNTSNHQTNAAATRAYMGSTTVADRKWDINWDGGAAPGTGTSRTGRQSVQV